jgi:hypothetical protein
MKITIRKAQQFYGAVKSMREAGVAAKGVKMLDIAMNKATLEPMILEYEKLQQQAAEGVAAYNREVAIAEKKEEMVALRIKYAPEIAAFELAQKDLAETLDAEKEVALITIKKTDLTIKEDNGAAAECLFGLLPCLVD